MEKGKYIRTKEHRIGMSLFKKDRTYEEMYGKEKAKKMKENMSITRLGKYPTPETRRKMSISFKGRKLSEKTKEKMRLSKLGDLNPAKREDVRLKLSKPKSEEHKQNMKKSWQNEERRNKSVTNMLKHKKIFPKEQKLLNIIEKNNLPFNYVGNGKAVFNGFCPDFLSKNPKHIIELFGAGHYNKEGRERNKRRLKAYSSLGYKTLIIANRELNNEEKVINKIKEFIK